jgi:hypothetical protein
MASHTTDGNPKPTTPPEPPAASAHDGAIVLSLVGGQQLVPQPLQYFTAGVDPLHPDIPRSYLLGDNDVAMPPGDYAWAPRFPQRLGVLPIYTPGSHEACFTRPVELADAILKV